MEIREVFPGDYSFIQSVEPSELDIAAEISIPSKTIEPWHVHYPPFREKIFVRKGRLVIQQPIWYKRSLDNYEANKPVGKNSVMIPDYMPHRLINPGDTPLVLVVESSPGPEHRLDLEPEFPSLSACLDHLHRQLVADMLKKGY